MRLSNNHARKRRGTITVIVVAFLALFAVLGLTFLIASQRFATTTRLNRESMTRERDTPPQPDVLMQQIMQEILFESKDDPTGPKGYYKATRGWSLARLMYGQNINPGLQNTLPYSGIGRKRDNALPSTVTGPTVLNLAANTPDFSLINYQYFPGDGFIRDPEMAGPTAGVRMVTDPTKTPDFANAPRNPNDYYHPINANYTAADENNPYLAVIDPTTGKVLVQSFHRQSAFGSLDKTNPNWTNKVGKYLTFRPRPNEHSPMFPYPNLSPDGSGVYGDVENLVGKSTGLTQYDSLWMDLDLDVQYWRGKRYKPLVALLITDLDSRVNVNTAANLRNGNNSVVLPATSPTYTHGANQNWGPWEVDLSPVFIDSNDASRLLRGNQATSGRYGGPTVTYAAPSPFPGGFPAASPGGYQAPGPFAKRYSTYANEAIDNNPTGGYLPHFYAPVDLDGGVAIVSAPPPVYPHVPFSGSQTDPYEQFKVFGPATPAGASGPFAIAPPYAADNRYWNGRSDNETSALMYTERLNHPMLFNPYLNPFKSLSPSAASINRESRSFQPFEMLALNARYMPQNNAIHPITGGNVLNTNTGLMRSDVAKLTSLGLNTNLTAANRFRMTTISNDLARPGATPWIFADPVTPFAAPQFVPQYPFIAAQQSHAASTNSAFGGGDYDTSRRQALATVLGAVDLNRPLTDYRANVNAPYSVANMAPGPQQIQALTDRQLLAADIFVRLRLATATPEPGTLTPSVPGTPNAQFEAARMLAQLSVNIVDFIDNDDYATPFNWNPLAAGVPNPSDNNGNLVVANASPYWVFGHELPRLVVNEAMVRLENDPTEKDIVTPPPSGMKGTATKDYKMRLWAELHNPLTPRDANEIGTLADSGRAQLVNANGAVYRMRLVKNSKTANANTMVTPIANLLSPANVGGEPDSLDLLTPIPATLNTAPANTVTEVFPNMIPAVPAQATGYANTNATQPSFYVVGCPGDATGGALPKLPDTVATQAHGQFTGFEYDVPLTEGIPTTVIGKTEWSPIIVLQRLANEHQAPGPMNPYITVDTFVTGSYIGASLDVIEVPTPVSIIQDRVQIDANAGRDGTMPPGYETIFAFGKRQPYDSRLKITNASTDTAYRQQPEEASTPGKIRHTFNRHNGMKTAGADGGNDTLQRPFLPMVHLDRSPTSAAELLNVSMFGPHMITQMFFANSTGAAAYKAPWLDERTLLYRAFDFLSIRGRFHGQGFAGRTPGKVNVNTLPFVDSTNLLDSKVFESLTCAQVLANSGKHYTVTDAANVLARIQTARNLVTKNDLLNGTTRPILGTMSPLTGPDPQYPNGMNSSMTIPGIIRDSGLNDLAKQEMMETLLPNLTTRSNTFAIYATIGFFEVLNPGTGPDGLTYTETNRPILGAEVIGVDGKAVRYKFYSVVDRTQLSVGTLGATKLQGIGNVHFSYEPVSYSNTGTLPTTQPVNVGSPDPQPPSGSSLLVTVAVPRIAFSGGAAVGHYDGIQWKLRVGDPLLLEYNPDSGIGPGTITGNNFLPSTVAATGRSRFEQVNVAAVADDAANGRALVTFAITKPHHRGCNLMMIRPDNVAFPFDAVPGSPGSQSNNFSLGANTYKTVIPVFERVDGY